MAPAGGTTAQPAVGGERSIGASETDAGDDGGHQGGGAGTQGSVDPDERGARRFHGRKQQATGGVQAQPAGPGEQATEEDEDCVVGGHRDGQSFGGIFAAPRAEEPNHSEGCEAAGSMNHAGATRIEEAEPSKPAAAPGEVRE